MKKIGLVALFALLLAGCDDGDGNASGIGRVIQSSPSQTAKTIKKKSIDT